jgi:hypothetical protein
VWLKLQVKDIRLGNETASSVAEQVTQAARHVDARRTLVRRIHTVLCSGIQEYTAATPLYAGTLILKAGLMISGKWNSLYGKASICSVAMVPSAQHC